MSWEKNTVNRSALEGTVRVLEHLKIPYKVTVLGEVIGLGKNDEVFEEDIKGILHREPKYYQIRKLEYKDVIILEQMVRNTDYDTDDYIMSYEFKKGLEPKDWKIEVEIK